VPGVKLVGPLPAGLQKWTTYTAVTMPGGKAPEAARTLTAFLAGDEARAAFATRGFAAP
jgi:molybdate transport system substrate-binding protein